MDIIFLDVDGVLNSARNAIQEYNKYMISRSGYNYPFDKECVLNLKKIVEQTGAALVVSSAWRRTQTGRKKLLEELKKYDLNEKVIGYTPIMNGFRETEIEEYLKLFKEIPPFIILDDAEPFYNLEEHLVRTSMEIGLTEENVNESVYKLIKQRNM